MTDRYSHRDNDRGLRGENYVKRKHDLEDSDVPWCDLRNPRTGSAHEVKVCEPGRRFRVWEDQQNSLASAHGQNAAWVHFLIVTDNGNVVDYRRVEAPTVTKIVRERGGWNKSGHDRGQRQHKLPEGDVF